MQRQPFARTKIIDAPPLAGFFNCDCYRLCVPDRLHTLHKGIGECIMGFSGNGSRSLLMKVLPETKRSRNAIFRQMNDSVRQSALLTGYKLPDTLFDEDAARIDSSKLGNLARLALVAFLCDDSTKKLIPILKGMFYII